MVHQALKTYVKDGEIISLRDYQKHSISLLAQSVRQKNRSPLLVISTGSGKTRTAAAICQRAIEKSNRVLFITPRRGLTFQASQDFDDLGIENGIIMSGVEHDNRHMVEVASMDTIISRLSRNCLTGALLGVEAADILIIDEAHLSVSDKRKQFLVFRRKDIRQAESVHRYCSPAGSQRAAVGGGIYAAGHAAYYRKTRRS